MPAKPPVHRPRFIPSKEERLARLRARTDAARPSARDRGYDRDWRELRAAFIQANPICSVQGCGEFTTDVDHFMSIKLHPHLRLVWDNLRPFCHAHHSQRTARDQGFGRNT